jgi:hypothetical protein
MIPSISVRIGSLGRDTIHDRGGPVKSAEPDGEKGLEAALGAGSKGRLAPGWIHDFLQNVYG